MYNISEFEFEEHSNAETYHPVLHNLHCRTELLRQIGSSGRQAAALQAKPGKGRRRAAQAARAPTSSAAPW